MKKMNGIHIDKWRVLNKTLFDAYIETYKKLSQQPHLNPAETLVEMFESRGIRGKLTSEDYGSAYTIAREVGIYYETEDGYFLSEIANSYVNDKLSYEDYLKYYCLNVEFLIRNKVVHPFEDIIDSLKDQILDKNEIAKKCSNLVPIGSPPTTTDSLRLFLNRCVEAKLLVEENYKYRLNYPYYLLKGSLNKSELNSDTFESLFISGDQKKAQQNIVEKLLERSVIHLFDSSFTLIREKSSFGNIIDNQLETKLYTSPNIDKLHPRNKIIYGAPGTGKSYELREQAKRLGFDEKRMKRVTFHPNYSYQQFVGSYKPSPIYKEFQEESALYGSDKTTKLESLHKKEPMIDYSFVPGIFLELLIKALNNPNEDYLLIIEEINRAPVSAVFGDVFQLLDRDSHGVSQYEITFNTEAQNFIIMNGIKSPEIKLPNNFFIWATMNSADQGVLPLDAAFKRRWSFEYLPLDKKEAIVKDANVQFMGESLNWNSFRTKINEKLKSIGVAEDKLIGPFFLSENERNNDNAIKNKLLLYLRDDVVRHNPESLFRQKTFSDIIGAYDNGKNVFKDISFEMEKTEIKDAEGDPTE